MKAGGAISAVLGPGEATGPPPLSGPPFGGLGTGGGGTAEPSTEVVTDLSTGARPASSADVSDCSMAFPLSQSLIASAGENHPAIECGSAAETATTWPDPG
jgi:hypothetical protein